MQHGLTSKDCQLTRNDRSIRATQEDISSKQAKSGNNHDLVEKVCDENGEVEIVAHRNNSCQPTPKYCSFPGRGL
jgi:hypothetical protein